MISTVIGPPQAAALRKANHLESGLPAQWTSQSTHHRRRPAPEHTTVLVADPNRETRQLLSGSLSDSGIDRVLVADSVDAVDAIIVGGKAGQLALVSLAFGDKRVSGLRSDACFPPDAPSAAPPLLDAGSDRGRRGHACAVARQQGRVGPAADKCSGWGRRLRAHDAFGEESSTRFVASVRRDLA